MTMIGSRKTFASWKKKNTVVKEEEFRVIIVKGLIEVKRAQLSVVKEKEKEKGTVFLGKS